MDQFGLQEGDITWPWKCDHPDLPDNFQVAVNRLRGLARCLTGIRTC